MTSTIFASPDIAALVAAFPPPTPTKDQPSLVRSLSGADLLSSTKVLLRFQHLLQNESKRIRISELSSILGIRETSWLFECLGGSTILSFNGDYLVPDAEVETLYQKLLSQASNDFVNPQSFGMEHDVSMERIWHKLELEERILRFQDSTGSKLSVVTSVDHIERLEDRMVQLLRNAGSEKVHLGRLIPRIPSLVRKLTDDVRNSTNDIDGGWEEDSEGAVFVPTSYLAAQNEKLQQERDLRLRQSCDAILENGWYAVSAERENADFLQTNIISEIRKRETGTFTPALVVLSLQEGGKALVQQSVLDGEMSELRAAMKSLAYTQQEYTTTVENSAIENRLIEASSKPQLATLIFQSQYRQDLQHALHALLEEAQGSRLLEFQRLVQNTLTAPLRLYAAGIVDEPTLKQHQEDYLLEYFRSEHIPRFVETTKSRNLDKLTTIKSKDIDKFLTQCSSARTFNDLSSTIFKFGKKHNILEPDASLLASLRKETLLQNIKSLRRMGRSSDVLQNVVWILLAQAWREDALFVTAGRDTSRMIKQFQLVGDAAIGRRLEQWRDAIKSGLVDERMMEEMRELAGQAVREMFPDVGAGEV